MKSLSAIALCGFFLLFNGVGVLAADHQPVDPATRLREMQQHMEKMRVERSQKYQAMVQRAGGRISDCLDCHEELKKYQK